MPPMSVQEALATMNGRLNAQAGELRRLRAQLNATPIAAASGGSGMAGLPAIPGSIWSLLAKLAWADPTIIRAHSLSLEADAQGVAAANGLSVESGTDVVAKSFFVVHTLSTFVERDPTVPAEEESSVHVTMQLEDEARNFPIFRESLRMASTAGTKNRRGDSIKYDEMPLTFIPNSRVIATFQPLIGFPAIASAVTGLTTRRVGMHLHGALVVQGVVDKLIEENRAILVKGRLLTP